MRKIAFRSEDLEQAGLVSKEIGFSVLRQPRVEAIENMQRKRCSRRRREAWYGAEEEERDERD